MRKMILLLISAFLSSTSFSADKLSRKASGVHSTLPKPQIETKPWEPTPFNQDADRLSQDYLGIDPVKFFNLFTSKLINIEKGEFETSEEFQKRTADTNVLLSPISTSDTYAFRVKYVNVKYDADTEKYTIDPNESYSCHETPPSIEHKNWVTCAISDINRHADSYVGSNGYGATQMIERTRGLDFSIAITNGSSALKTILSPHSRINGKYTLHNSLHIPLEKARTLKGMNIAVLFVGRVIDAQIIEGQGQSIKPTMDSPTDYAIQERAIPFHLKKIVYYVIQTGEILGQKPLKDNKTTEERPQSFKLSPTGTLEAVRDRRNRANDGPTGELPDTSSFKQ